MSLVELQGVQLAAGELVEDQAELVDVDVDGKPSVPTAIDRSGSGGRAGEAGP